MSYLVLARKWRPRQFADIAGQEHVVRALVNALDGGRLHHAFLFSGTRGVGKTTVARVLAKALNCERGVSSLPCGECSACREIDEGRFVDLIEVDAASRTKVDDTRELLENVQYAPTRGRYKVYLIDEVHQFSNHSFNALLKTLEEPPPHVKFLLATTDPQKVPVTVLSRCLQFHLKRLPAALIQERLRVIAEQEGVPAEAPALKRLAVAARGSVRDALSLLDQAIGYGGGRLLERDVQVMLGGIDREAAGRLVAALAAGDAQSLLAQVARLDESAPDYAVALDEIATLLQRIALAQAVPEAVVDEDERRALGSLASSMSADDVQLYYQIALIGRRDLELTPDPRVGFEMTLLRMLAFGREGTPEPERARAATRVAGAPGADGSPKPTRASAAGSGEWGSMLGALALQGGARQLAAHCTLERRQGAALQLRLDPAHANLLTNQLHERLRAALENHLQERVELRIEIGEPQVETPARRDARLADARRQGARDAIEQDPNVAALQRELDATVMPDSIEPLG